MPKKQTAEERAASNPSFIVARVDREKAEGKHRGETANTIIRAKIDGGSGAAPVVTARKPKRSASRTTTTRPPRATRTRSTPPATSTET